MGERYTNETMKVLRVSFLSALVLELAATISVALIAVSIGLRLVNGSIEFLPSLAILVLAPEVYFPLRNAASLFHASADGTTALAELNDIQSINPSTSRVGGAAIDAITSIQWDLWQSPFGTGVLTAAVRGSGEITIVRGGSGLGKTTFLNTFLGYGDSSHVRINEKPIADYDSNKLRSNIGWVPQNPVLISGTVRELFHFFDKSVSDDEIVQALKRVGLEVDQLSDGLQTKIGGSGERVAAFSGGQIRRIAIARALFIEPTLLIADEPTADLDPQSAQEVLQILSDIAATGTIVLVVLHAPDHVIPSAIEMEMVQR
jgi:ABC-type transport system involved in cytochrome bd biosynthesis fused ATPase/permease subunit